jgi:hypothetical protein
VKYDNTHLKKQSSNNISKLKLLPVELRKKSSRDLLGYSHDSFVRIWHDMYGVNIWNL